MKEINDAEEHYLAAQKSFHDAKKKLVDAETRLIETKINREQAHEQMRKFKESDPNVEKSLRDISIDRFRENHPELIQEISDRSKIK